MNLIGAQILDHRVGHESCVPGNGSFNACQVTKGWIKINKLTSLSVVWPDFAIPHNKRTRITLKIGVFAP